MIVPDINLLLYAVISGFAEHEKARAWWEDALSGTTRVGITPPVAFGFLRLGTNPRVFDEPLSVAAATGYLEEWLARPNVEVPAATPRHLTTAFDLVRAVGVAGNLTTDAEIAAYAITHGGTVHSNDTDFARFPGVRWENPLR